MLSQETASSSQAVQHRAALPPLAELIAFLWYWRGHTAERAFERVLPLPTTELVIDLARGLTAGTAGPRSESFIIERSAHAELIGVHFRTGGIAPFLRFPAGARELLGRLHEAPDVEAKFALLESWLLRIAQRPPQQDPAVAFTLRELRRDPVAPAASYFDQAPFNHEFRACSGLTPTEYLGLRTAHVNHGQVR